MSVSISQLSGRDAFRHDVCAWLCAVQRASGHRWSPAAAWFDVFKPWLARIAGPNARSARGRSAGQRGYQLLACEFRTLFGIDVPPRATSLLEDDGMAHDAEAEVVATLHALPLQMRLDPNLMPRLLALVVRLCERAAVIDESMASMVDVLQRALAGRANAHRAPVTTETACRASSAS